MMRRRVNIKELKAESGWGEREKIDSKSNLGPHFKGRLEKSLRILIEDEGQSDFW